jgi:hypothetical protein
MGQILEYWTEYSDFFNATAAILQILQILIYSKNQTGPKSDFEKVLGHLLDNRIYSTKLLHSCSPTSGVPEMYPVNLFSHRK